MSWSDTTPASNVSGAHSYLAAVRRTDRIPLWHLLGVFMTLQEAKSIARHLGLTLRTKHKKALTRVASPARRAKRLTIGTKAGK